MEKPRTLITTPAMLALIDLCLTTKAEPRFADDAAGTVILRFHKPESVTDTLEYECQGCRGRDRINESLAVDADHKSAVIAFIQRWLPASAGEPDELIFRLENKKPQEVHAS